MRDDTEDRKEWLSILRHNHGFLDPESWISYARSKGFRRVDASPVDACPDCGGSESSVLGQFVYYSSLVRLRACAACELIYADTCIDPRILERHFESAYKDEEYFTQRREPIFRYLASIVDAFAGRGARVIDVGGAKGHLLAAIQTQRPDLQLTLTDIAAKACEHAQATYGLRTIRGSVADLGRLSEQFDVILMIDVMYYEAEIASLWKTIERIASDDCTLILRLPDRLRFISLQEKLGRLFRGDERESNRTSIRFFNPEHVAVYSKRYLRDRLTRLRFDEIRFLPSPLLRVPGIRGAMGAVSFKLASFLHRATRGAVTLTPCFIVVARRVRP